VAVADLGDDALKSNLARVCKHLRAIDLEALTELEVGPLDDFLQVLLALHQRTLSKIKAIEIEKVEGDQDNLCRLSLQLVLKD
jgi:hypothetical protein